jgi:murein DD-endopeptidase MepM/ murein hydrolase activator NlpD
VSGVDRKGNAGSNAKDVLSELTASTEHVILDTVTRDETLSDIFMKNEVSYAELLEVMKVSKVHFNLNRIRSGSVVKLAFDGEARFSRLEYEIDDRRLLRVTVHKPDSMSAGVDEVEYQYRYRLVGGEISSSLYQTIQNMNENLEIAFLLSEIFAWQVDFSTDLRSGDYFGAVVEEYWGRDGVIRLNTVIASEFFNNGKLYQAFRYEDPDGHIDYYDGTGSSLRRKFLKSPLKYTRISSRFSRRRLHPILKVYRPHLGVDYAAPIGTPVVTVGDGEIIFAGWQRGFGNIVKVRHNGTYKTTYGHLNGFARGIRKGVKVMQGKVIGYVGSTGLSNGPHLDFRLIKRGNYVNPLTVDLPAADPVKKEYSADFRRRVLDYMEILDSDKDTILASTTEVDSL